MSDTEAASYENDYETVFKQPSIKVATGRNRLSECGYSGCDNVEHLWKRKFSVCAKCRSTRYCAREHQVADWKSHKAQCRNARAKERADTTLASSPGSPTQKQIISNLLEDFIHLHESTFFEIINFAYHDARRQLANKLDFSSVPAAVELILKYRPDCDGNPAEAFELHDVQTLDTPDNIPESVIENTRRFNTARKDDPTFIRGVISIYTIIGYDSSYLPSTALGRVGIYKPDAPFKLKQKWMDEMSTMICAGIVLRKVKVQGTDEGIWVPGCLCKSNSRWMWNPIPPILPPTFSLALPPIKHWGRTKLAGVVYAPDSDTDLWEAYMDSTT